MKKYRKKPVIIEAIQYNGLNNHDIKLFCGDCCNVEIHDAAYQAGVYPPVAIVEIYTLEGIMTVNKNDFVIKGVKGEFYPCKPDIFEITYEEVDEN